MPIIGGNAPANQSQAGTDIVKVPNTTFAYSMTRIADLEASEYTFAAIVNDVSPSVEPWKTLMEEQGIKTVIDACQKSPRAANLLLRLSMFASGVREVHGWKMLNQINRDDYTDCLKISGSTALFDGAVEALEVLHDSGKKLTASRFTVNGVAFIITDGENNSGFNRSPSAIKAAIDKIRQEESLESLVTILIGVGCGDDSKPRSAREQSLYDYLMTIKNEGGITHFISLGEATKSNIAKLAAFISKSISDQSQALGTGGPSQSLATNQSLKI